MDKDTVDETTARRKLKFCSQEQDTVIEEEIIGNDSGENAIIEHTSIPVGKTPELGMQFDSEEAAYKFYNEYAKLAGFSVRRHTVHMDISGRILDRTFVCWRQGHRKKDKRDFDTKSHRPETRNGCGAKMKIDARYTGKYTVVDFVADHDSHELVSPSKTHFLRSHRTITAAQALQADDLDSSGIAPKAGFTLMARQMGGRENVGFTFQDYKNHLRSKRTRQMEIGDTGGVLEYLQQKQLNDPSFFYAIQVDEDDLIANIIWVDSRMMVDYVHFGDVVCFDTTYKKNKDGRPIALFVGVNHHKQTIIFGAALLYDETAATFSWLFDTFARAMTGKQPKTILTDQDVAMAKALAEVWPGTYHRLCIWHIYQNAAIHLSHVFAEFVSFSKDFKSCIYDYEEEEEFINGWNEMLEKYGLQGNEWMKRLFNIRKKWALVYGRQSFCGDMTTTQRSESMNSILKRYVNCRHNLVQFFHHFDRLVDDRRYDESKADLDASQSTPVPTFPIQILKHAASVYTYEVLELFQDELSKSYDDKLEWCGDNGETSEYRVTPLGKKYQHTVKYVSNESKVSCSCKKFEFAGILCAHALKVLSSRNILKIPEFYIKKRWTKAAKKNTVEAHIPVVGVECGSTDKMDEKKVVGVRYKELYGFYNQLATRASLTDETVRIVKDGLCKLMDEVEVSLENSYTVAPTSGPKFPGKKDGVSRVVSEKQNSGASGEIEVGSKDDRYASTGVVVKGWKKKEDKPVRSGKRAKSGLEKSRRKKKLNQDNVSSSINAAAHEVPNDQLQSFNNGNYEVNKTTSSISYLTEGSSLPYMAPLHFLEVSNPLVDQNLACFPSRENQKNDMSLTALLQQQLIKSKDMRNFI